MREIKFRAWCEPNKKYFFTDEMVKDQFALLPNGYFANISGRSTSESVIYTHEQYLPEQFTGQHDKNKKEIYHNDLFKDSTGVFLVVWNDAYASWCLRRPGWAFDYFFGEAVDAKDGEVIGNIHENPELAKEFL